jgi:hypothetical protein
MALPADIDWRLGSTRIGAGATVLAAPVALAADADRRPW